MSYLSHHGILGQKWGIRRFQNADGSLTPAGRQRRISEEEIDSEKSSYKDRTTGERATPKKLSEMNDDDLKTHLKRLQDEKLYEEVADYELRDARRESSYRENQRKNLDITSDPAYIALENKVKMMRLEREYKGYLGEQEKAMHPAREFVKDVLKESGKQVAKEFVTNAMRDFVNKKVGKTKSKGGSP